ncbi:uncharacterized protein LOC132316338 [Cornus florida]|uniref:uncharacterized protein LOC132316338 n=1 Tax=Cornus florida TaxID=4283 RepID=UPI00289DD6A5|nr:uncharacterized protein LOC132316338 [Cornus florida]
MPSRYLTRNAKAVLGQGSTLRYPIPSTKWCHCCTLTPTRTYFKATDISIPATGDIPISEKITSEFPIQIQVSDSPAASMMYPPKRQKTTPNHTGSPRLAKRGKAIRSIYDSTTISSTSNVEVHLEKLISEVIIPHILEDEELKVGAALSPPHVVVSDKHLPTREANEASSIVGSGPEGSASNGNQREENLGRTLSPDLTEMTEMLDDISCDLDEVGSFLDSTLVTVNGYVVKPEWGSLLRAIFSRYGDIAKDCSVVSIRSRSSFLEMICEIIQKLHDTEFIRITPVDLKSMLDQVRDLETVRMEVGWLRERLDDIFEAMQLFRGYSTLKEAQRRKVPAIEKKKEELKSINMEIVDLLEKFVFLKEKAALAEEELTPMKAEAEKIDETVSETKAKVKCFYQKSLVHGLV